jgi:hypothetical protein
MKIASPAYTGEELLAFLNEMQDHDRHMLADRLQRASDRLAEIAPRVKASRSENDEWSAHEVLAHIASLSKFYGVVVHRMVSGQITDLNLLEAAQLRDPTIDKWSEREPAELLQMTLVDHERTIKTLRTADPASLRRTARLPEGGTMTAEEIARLPLIAHIESHIEQLEKLLATSR